MANPELNIRLVAEHRDDSNQQPSCTLDFEHILSGFKVNGVDKICLEPSAVDQPYAFVDAVALLITSDKPFSLRHAAGEKLLANMRMYAWVADTAAIPGVMQSGILLTGNTANQATLTIWKYEAL